MKILVTVTVLQIEQGAIVLRPEKLADAALFVRGDNPGVVGANDLDPDLEDVVGVRLQPCQVFAIGRQRRGVPLRVSKENVAWKSWKAVSQRGHRRRGRRRQNSEREHAVQPVLMSPCHARTYLNFGAAVNGNSEGVESRRGTNFHEGMATKRHKGHKREKKFLICDF
ncbi:hypothetical protein [Pedosphaera parvula]|uniref:hypothetical protein n=1 Tax=Pedosphaera parvula TaxID=1032527 RepID=UPI0002DBAA2A|nr:hypothetical protein [Pedosphaera parvula]